MTLIFSWLSIEDSNWPQKVCQFIISPSNFWIFKFGSLDPPGGWCDNLRVASYESRVTSWEFFMRVASYILRVENKNYKLPIWHIFTIHTNMQLSKSTVNKDSISISQKFSTQSVTCFLHVEYFESFRWNFLNSSDNNVYLT